MELQEPETSSIETKEDTMDRNVYRFSNSTDAKRFVSAHGGPIDIDVENPKRGLWIVTITSK